MERISTPFFIYLCGLEVVGNVCGAKAATNIILIAGKYVSNDVFIWYHFQWIWLPPEMTSKILVDQSRCMLGTKVRKYYHAVKIRDDKRGIERTIFTWKPLIK